MNVNTAMTNLSFSPGGTERMRATLADASPQNALEKYVNMTPAERMRDALLKKLGVTEEELANMKPEERKGMEEKIADLTKREMEEKQETPPKGSFVNVAV